MMATARPTRHYQFVGGPTFEALFLPHQGGEDNRYVEFPGKLPYSSLHFFANKWKRRPEKFALLTEPGILHGKLLFGSQDGDSTTSITKAHHLTQYPSSDVPLSMATTMFHFVLLYSRHIAVVSRISGEVVHEEFLQGNLRDARGLVRDPVENRIWVYSSSGLREVIFHNEERNVWRLYLDKAKAQVDDFSERRS